jgi:cytochrome c oxidase cbb3-type subunit 1
MIPSSTGSTTAAVHRPALGEVDASFRAVSAFFLAKASAWLVFGGLLLLLASVKLHAPGMMAGRAWLTYGRLLPAGWDALVFGGVGQAGFAVGLWLLGRAAGQRLQAPLLVLAGGVLWNLGVLAGVVGILVGYSTGRELMEMPAGAMAVLLVAGGLVGASGWMTYAGRTESAPYPSAWFVLLALLSFVWVGTVALMMFSGDGVRGVVQVLVQRWYANGALRLWLGGIGLAVVFHWLPLLAGRPLASRQLALMAFWSLAFFAPWSVTAHGDPLPRWLVSVGIAGQFLSAIALVAVGLNWWKTVEGAWDRLRASPAGVLLAAGAIAQLAAGALGFVTTLRGPSAALRLTWVHAGLDWLLVGGVLLALVAVLPEFVERSTGRRLAPGLVRAHGWLTLGGVALTAVPFVLAGLVQGARLTDPGAAFLDSLRGSMHLVRLSSLGHLVFLLGQVILWVAWVGWWRARAVEGLASARLWATSAPSGKAAEVRS